MSLQFEAADGGFVRWLMVTDLRELPTLDDLLGRSDWQRRAACRGTKGFGVGRGGRGYTKAQELCAGSSVRQECLDELALADDALVGLWGGRLRASGGRCD